MLGLDDAFCFVSEPLLNDINFQSYFLWFGFFHHLKTTLVSSYEKSNVPQI
jgi:hypothetical protein